MLQSLGQKSTEITPRIICIMSQLTKVNGIVNEISDLTFELVDQIYDLLFSLTEPGSPDK